MTSKTTAIVIVPGACGPAYLYDPTVQLLHARGFAPDAVKVVSLPTVGRPSPSNPPSPPPGMYDDVNVVRQELEKLADAGYDILLVAHSYGGIPATESIKGLSKKARAAEGKAGGVARLFYTTAVAAKVGETLADILGQATGPGNVLFEDGYFKNEVEYSARMNFSDLPHDEALEWAKKLDWHSSLSFTNPLTYPGYNDVPVSYLFCEEDQVLPPKLQESFIANAQQSSEQEVEVFRIKAGHIPYASQIDNVADLIAQVARHLQE